MNRISAQGNWSQPHKKELRAMPVQFWPCHNADQDAVCAAIYRAIDFADAMRCVVSLDFCGGSLIVGHGAEFEDCMDNYILLMATVKR